MKKVLLLVLVFLLHVSACCAATQVKVFALQEFHTAKPASTFDAQVRESIELGHYMLPTNSVLHCQVLQIIDPKRGKINATFFVKPVAYTYRNRTFSIKDEMYGKYSKTVLSKEELKKIPPSKVIKGAAVMVGNYFVKGLSIGLSFAKGVFNNEEDNRLKSGIVKAYEESPLSYVEEGEQLDIKIGDEFYLVFKTEDDEKEPNYTYTMEE